MIPTINNLCDCCDSDQSILQLFEDKCFRIIEGDKTTGSFCIGDFAFPADGHTCLNLNITVSNGETMIFDNEIVSFGSPNSKLISGNNYARGIMLKITYPVNDHNGEEISILDKDVQLWIEDVSTLTWKQYPLYNLFMIFTNPKSNDPDQLINRIKIVNPNSFKVKVTGLIVYGEAQ